jgi:hypothetical protein
MALAARRGQQQVMRRHVLPLRLVQVLAHVQRARVVGAVPFHRDRPMVGGPEYLYTRIAGTGGPSAETGEQIDCCGHICSISLYLLSGGIVYGALTFLERYVFSSKVLIDGYEIVASGVVHLNGPSFELIFDGMPVEFNFIKGEGASTYNFEPKGNGLSFNLIAFSNALGEGKFEPISIATTQGRDVKLTFFVNTIDVEANTRVFSYTILMGAGVNG